MFSLNCSGLFSKETSKASPTVLPQNDFVTSSNFSGTSFFPLPPALHPFTFAVPTVSFVASAKSASTESLAVLRSTPEVKNTTGVSTRSTDFPRVTVLQEGDWVRVSDSKFQFPSSVVLVEDGSWLVLVDTGVPMDRTRLLESWLDQCEHQQNIHS